MPGQTLWSPRRRHECLKSFLTSSFVLDRRRRIGRCEGRRHEEGPFAYVGGDFWPLIDDCGGSSVSGTRVVTATLG